MKTALSILTKYSLICVCVHISFTSSAQAPKSQSYNDLEHIVISGTRTPKLLSNSPVSIQVIDQETIEILTQGTLANALNFIPGLVVTRNVKGGYNIQMQGFDGDHVLVLINSQPLISPAGAAADLDQINANEIQQIEVLRGAASVMYGSSAMGGVINIITKDYDESQAKFNMQVGHYADAVSDDPLSYTARMNASLSTDDWDYKISLLHIDDTGFDYRPSTISQDASGMTKSFINLSTKTDFLNLYSNELSSNKINAEVKYQYLTENKSRPTSIVPGQGSIISYLSEVEQNQLDFSLSTDVLNNKKGDIQQGSWQLNTRYINHQETSGQSNSIRNTDINLAEINGQYMSSSNTLEIVSGGVIHYDSLDQIKPVIDSIEINNESRQSIDAFIQANWINTNYQILAGLRSQHDSDFGFHSAARISTLNNFGDEEHRWQWRNGLGQGYRVPTLKERFYIFDHSNLGYMVLGSTNLKPEESSTINSTLSFNTEVFKNSTLFNQAKIKTELNVHYSTTKNFIETVHDADKSTAAQLDISVYQNVAQATIQGIDFSIDLSFNQWSGQLNYSYLDARNAEDQRLNSRPYHQVKTNLAYHHYEHQLDVLFYLVYQSDEAYDSSYSQLLNNHWLNANVSINQSISNQLSWSFGINNIFNEHKDADAKSLNAFDSRPISSRNINLGMKYQF